MTDRWVAVAAATGDASETIAPFDLDKRQYLLIRHGGKIFACERACPHEQADLAAGNCVGGRLHCPRHQASFDLADGSVSQGWKTRPLLILPTRISEQTIWIMRPTMTKN